MKIVEELLPEEFKTVITNYHFPLLKEISDELLKVPNVKIMGRFDGEVPCSLLLYHIQDNVCTLDCVESLDGRCGYFSGASAQLVIYLIKLMKQIGISRIELTCSQSLSHYFSILGFSVIDENANSYYMVEEIGNK